MGKNFEEKEPCVTGLNNKKAEKGVDSSSYKMAVMLTNRAMQNATKRYQNQTIADCNKAIAIASKNGYTNLLLRLYTLLSDQYNPATNMTKRLDACYKGLRLAEKVNDKKQTAFFYSKISLCYLALNDTSNALKVQHMCLKLYEELNDSTWIAGTLMDIGATYQRNNQTDKGATYQISCKKYLAGIRNLHYKAETYNAIAAGLAGKNKLTEAMLYIDSAYQLVSNLDYKYGIAGVLAQRGEILTLQNKYEAAEQTLLKALDVSEKANFTENLTYVYRSLYELYVEKGQYDKALAAYKNEITTREQIVNTKNNKIAIEKEFNYQLEKKENENKLLVQQNQIQTLKLSQNRNVFTGLLITVFLIATIVLQFVRQNRLVNQRQKVELEQKLLLVQMNPHFLFNSLQAIQNYILKKDEKSAISYISSFSAVTRNVLEHSKKEWIPLKKELELITSYLKLQKIRFGDQFDYSINIDEGINPEEIVIMPMLAQPFIENAIEHGIKAFEKDGKIEIKYYREQNRLMVQIVDNGPGIAEGTLTTHSHESLAMQITRERIKLAEKQTGKQFSFQISVAFPDQKIRKGTNISIGIPMINN